MTPHAPTNAAVARVGLLADSHGRAVTTQRAVRLLIEQHVDLILHLGDVCSVDVIDALIEQLGPQGTLKPPVHLVFGNCDWDAASLGRYAKSLGICVDHPVGRVMVAGKTIVFQHGHQQAAMDQALAEGVDYLCHGHTHRQSDTRQGPTRIINPGALFRAAHYTVAVLDVPHDRVTFHTLADD